MEFGPEMVKKVVLCGLTGRDRLVVIGYLACRASGEVVSSPIWNRARQLAETLGLEDPKAVVA